MLFASLFVFWLSIQTFSQHGRRAGPPGKSTEKERCCSKCQSQRHDHQFLPSISKTCLIFYSLNFFPAKQHAYAFCRERRQAKKNNCKSQIILIGWFHLVHPSIV